MNGIVIVLSYLFIVPSPFLAREKVKHSLMHFILNQN